MRGRRENLDLWRPLASGQGRGSGREDGWKAPEAADAAEGGGQGFGEAWLVGQGRESEAADVSRSWATLDGSRQRLGWLLAVDRERVWG